MADPQHLISGRKAEDCALRLLTDKGLKLITRNYRAKSGELDLVMLDQQQLVIVEVRFRRHTAYGTAAETVNPAKQRRIIAATQQYLLQHPEHNRRSIRFDVVASQAHQNPEWIQNAFQTN